MNPENQDDNQNLDAEHAGEGAAGGESQQQQDQLRQQAETKARAMGWRPKDQFRGDPTKWVEAEEFVRRGEQHLPILRDRLDRTQRELEELRQTSREALEMQRENQKRERARLQAEIDDLKAKRRDAVASGDQAAFDAAERGIEQREKVMPPEPKAPVEPAAGRDIPPEALEFEQRNEWFRSDPVLRRKAIALHNAQLADPDDKRPLAEKLLEVENEVKRLHPHKFSNQRRNGASSVDGGGDLGGGGQPRNGAKKGYQDLPAEARAACDRYVGQKLMTREQYIADYFGA